MKKNYGIALLAGVVFILLAVLGGRKIYERKVQQDAMKIQDFHNELLGENVYLFREEDDHQKIQQTLDALYAVRETAQFGDERIALCFFPGDYSDLTVNVGFYTQVLGLGALPTDVKIGKLQCTATWLGNDPGNHNACCNFWRSVENVELLSNTMWAVSQATDMRRVQVDGALYLHDNYGWCSGGYLADSAIATMIDSGTQQQWLSRNNQYKAWMSENWNMVMVGDDPDGLPTGTWPAKAYTEVAEADIVQDKPLFLWTDPKTRENMGIYVPAKRAHAVATSWNTAKDLKAEDYEPAPVVTDLSLFPENLGYISPMDDWYIAHAGEDTAKSLNRALENGRHLLFTPGIYYLEEPLQVQQNGRILLGLGLATLRPTKGNICVETRADDLILAGLLLDAGSAYIPVNGTDSAEKSLGEPVISPNLLVVGKGKNVSLNDLYFRVGGCDTQEPAQATCCITIDADRVIGDNLWVWRADHGDQVAWDKNVTKNGIVINGDDAVMYALMVEHFHEYQTIWRGNGGRLYMYQSEIPYDVPSNEVWMSREGTRAGYASLFIDDETESFHGEGIGIYLYNRDAPVLLESAMEMPDKEGVSVHHIITVMLNGNPGMHHVINDAGNAVMTRGAEAVLLDYEKGEYR